MNDNKHMEEFISQCPGFVYSSHPTPTTHRYVFCDAHVCVTLDEAYAYAHVINARLRPATEKENQLWEQGKPISGGVRSRDNKLYIDTEVAASAVFGEQEENS